MNLSTHVPVTFTSEAAARVAELGMDGQLRQMLDHARQVLPDLCRLEVTLAERYTDGGEPGITIEAFVRRAFDPEDTSRWNLGEWNVRTFPPQVCEHFVITVGYEDESAR
jgi:hypothetical protein